MKIFMLITIIGSLQGYVGPFSDPDTCGKIKHDHYKRLSYAWNDPETRKDLEKRYNGVTKEQIVYDCVASENPPVISK